MKRGSPKSASRGEVPLESRSLAKGLQILESFSSRPDPISLRQVSDLVGLGKASTLRLLRTLTATGYLTRDANDNYTLGREWPSLNRENRLRVLRGAALPHLQRLNTELGETVALAFLFEDIIRVVDVVESTYPIRMSNYRGRVLQPYASSLGKAITAFQSPQVIQRLLYTYGVFSLTANTLTDYRAILDEFAAVRQNGYAWDREETVMGGTCLGAPVRCQRGEVCCSISMSTPQARFTRQLEEVLPGLITECAKRIGEALPQDEICVGCPATCEIRLAANGRSAGSSGPFVS